MHAGECLTNGRIFLNTVNERRIALFLDFENLVTNTGITAGTFDLRPTLDRLLEKGKVIYRRAYCDWGRFKDAKGTLHELGVELVDVPPSTKAGKNGADMRLVIDALELCYARGYIDTFVIGSGDSDFCPLAYKLRENDRRVIGIGVKESTSGLFLRACDEFIYLKPPAERAERKARPSRGKAAAASKPAAPAQDAKKGGKKVPDIAREVVSSLLAQATGPINPSLIKEAIVRKQPDFDEREHGFSTFSKLLAALEAEGFCKRQQLRGRQWYVVPPDAAGPTEPAEDAVVESEERAGAAPAADDEVPF
jgi:uncharacterized LabA/DUF88 family protein